VRILYRCPECHSVLIRDSELDAMIAVAPSKATYECSICHHFTPASDILSGKYDLQRIDQARVPALRSSLPSLPEVLDKLEQEHDPSYVYRGQIREWRAPLIPSANRGMVSPEPATAWLPGMRLRGRGNMFHEQLPPSPSNLTKEKADRIDRLCYLVELFGYPLAQLLAQQCGIGSEGLDVTSSPSVAAFFAIYDFARNIFVDSSDEPGVIYRFRVQHKEATIENLKTINFYSCPMYLGFSQLQALASCDSWHTAVDSFFQYHVAFGEAKLKEPPLVRPLELLRLPHRELARSRIACQEAGLVFPDMILTKFYSTLGQPPPAGKAEKEGMPAIEDLSAGDRTEKLVFRHSSEDKRFIPLSPLQLFPQQDPFLTMLATFLSPASIGKWVFLTEYGFVADAGGPEMLR